MSWAVDDRQYAAVCDGYCWFKPRRSFFNSRLHSIRGGPDHARFEDVPGYPLLAPPPNLPRYYGFGTIALDDAIYQYLATMNGPLGLDGVRFNGSKLIFSHDKGGTWFNQDGTTPVVWEGWEERTRDRLVFLNEPQDAFSLVTILQMGRNYEANADGYVYAYSPNGSNDGTMNELVMFRVRKDSLDSLLERKAYEYFAGTRGGTDPSWVPDIESRAVVHSFPRGWVNRSLHPYAWVPSVAYFEALGLYVMTTFGMGVAPNGYWFGKPSYLGFWVASSPWGPWTQIHEETAWTPDNDPEARAYSPVIAPKWIAADGRSFWLVWSDFQQMGDDVNGPYYGFNTQRVDVVIA